MQPTFVTVNCDIHCDSASVEKNPVYRLYVGNELFAERAWRWTNCYLEERLSIRAPQGLYSIKLENVTPAAGQLTMNNVRVCQGPGRILENNTLEIQS